MSMIVGPYFSGDSKVFTRPWGNYSAVQSAFFVNLESFGIDPKLAALGVKFWEGGNNVYDYAQGLIAPVLGSSITYADGKRNFDGNGNNDRINLGSITSDNILSGYPTGEIMVLAGINDTGLTSHSSFPRLIDKSDNTAGRDGWTLWRNVGKIWLGVDATTASFNYSIPTNTDIDIAVGLKSGDSKLYEGGEFKASLTTSFTFAPDTELAAIGNWNHSTDRNWHGDISYIIVLASIITPDQVAAIADRPEQLWQPVPQKTIFLPLESGGASISVAGSLPAMAGALTQKKSYHRAFEGSI